MKYKGTILLLLTISLMFNCSSGSESDEDNSAAPGLWLIPVEEVFDGGPGQDGIPSVDSPEFLEISEIGFLTDDDLVIALNLNGEIHVYPHVIMDWHEIVNDLSSDKPVILNYCPLTGSALAFEANTEHSNPTFGVSGLLYNTNLILYDRETASFWSQMRLECVNGDRIRETPTTIHIFETSWSTLKEMYPEALVLSTNTGFPRGYGTYPYGTYRSDERLLFPVDYEDDRLPKKTRVFGISAPGQAKAFPLEQFGPQIHIYNDTLADEKVTIVGSFGKNFATGFFNNLNDGTELTFSAIQDELPAILTDQEGNKWDMFGEAISGPRAGEVLRSVGGYTSFWFAWVAFNHGSTLQEASTP